MTRHLDVKQEQRESARQLALVKAIEFELVGSIESQGAQLRGFSMKYVPFNCLLTLRADFQGRWHVAHVASETIPGCFIKASTAARNNALRWSVDKYQPDQD